MQAKKKNYLLLPLLHRRKPWGMVDCIFCSDKGTMLLSCCALTILYAKQWRCKYIVRTTACISCCQPRDKVCLFSIRSPQGFGSGNFLVTFSGVPAGDFVVRLRGEDTSSTSRATPSSFQRQASTQIKTSSISVTVSSSHQIVTDIGFS